mgnify:CR=1 FL=1
MKKIKNDFFLRPQNHIRRWTKNGKNKIRDGKIIEQIGTYNPMTDPVSIVLDKEKVEKWIKNGAKPTDTVKALIKKANA